MAARSGLVPIARRLRDDVSALRFEGLVAHVYNPLTYAWAPHHEYLERYGRGRRDVLIVGMNAGYFGMVQTGVPFGDVEMVRDWLVIQQAVKRPNDEHPRRPIEGFSCRRHDVSGQRLWGWARDGHSLSTLIAAIRHRPTADWDRLPFRHRSTSAGPCRLSRPFRRGPS